MNQPAIDAFESVPEIKAAIDGFKAEMEKENGPIDAKLANPNLPEAVKDELKKDKLTYVEYKTALFVDPENGDYTQKVDENGHALYSVKFKQRSIQKQLDAGTKASDVIYIQHYLKDEVTGKMNHILKDENGNYFAKQTFEGGEIIVQVNTKIQKYPSTNQHILTMSRLVKVFHLVEGTAGESVGEAVNNPFDDDEFKDLADTVETNKVAKPKEDTPPSGSEYDAPVDTQTSPAKEVPASSAPAEENEYA